MFYLYIDEVLISSYHNFSEVREFIFDFFSDPVEFVSGFSLKSIVTLNDCFDDCIVSLICHQYAEFEFYHHRVKVYYGS